MSGIAISQIKSVISTQAAHCPAPHLQVDFLVTDSRRLMWAERSIFIAIKGKRFNGHNFIAGLFANGMRNFIGTEPIEKLIERLPKTQTEAFKKQANYIMVPQAIAALQQIAAYQRRIATKTTVVAITGSNGKTMVKEWAVSMLSSQYAIAASPNSYNSQIGVPLSVWGLNNQHTLGIFEAGISQPGEMQKLAAVIQPHIGIFTNIGPAHDSGFESRSQKIAEKAQLFAHCEVVICRQSHTQVYGHLQQCKPPKQQLYAWQLNPTTEGYATLNIEVTHPLGVQNKKITVPMPFTQAVYQENIAHILTLMVALNHSPAQIEKATRLAHNVPMRLEIKQGKQNAQLINDTYNNDPAGFEIALNLLAAKSKAAQCPTTVVLSDMLSGGKTGSELAMWVNNLLVKKNIDRLLVVGSEFTQQAHCFAQPEKHFYPNTQALLTALPQHNFTNHWVLIKGARPFAFEQITAALQQRHHGAHLEINLDALAHNLNTYRQHLGADMRIMAMVKALAYGNGSREVASLLQWHRVNYLAVAYPDEGIALRQAGISLPIMVMNVRPGQLTMLAQHRLEPQVYSHEMLTAVCHNQMAGALPGIHIKFDTGMHRLGFMPHQVAKVLTQIKKEKAPPLKSVLTHMPVADQATHDAFNQKQITAFAQIAQQVKAVFPDALAHMANTAAATRYPQARFDMVRLGIGLYGENVAGLPSVKLLPVATFKTEVTQVRTVAANEGIGYGLTDAANAPRQIATIAAGYADGLPRALSNGAGSVFIKGKACPIVGRVCMDMTMVDVTNLAIEPGDVVEIFGQNITANEQATAANTITYELFTGISDRIPRVFYQDS